MSTRRDFIKWVVYLGAISQLPAVSSTSDLPYDVLEGVSLVPKKLCDLAGFGKFRADEDAAFERCMKDYWHEHRGCARYVRVERDLGLQPARRHVHEDGTVVNEPEGYVSLFQYRRV